MLCENWPGPWARDDNGPYDFSSIALEQSFSFYENHCSSCNAI